MLNTFQHCSLLTDSPSTIVLNLESDRNSHSVLWNYCIERFVRRNMKKPKFQYKEGEQILEEAGDNTRFDLKFAEEIADEIVRKLFGLWDWRSALEAVYAPSGLESLANLWLRNQTPDLAYAYVVEVNYPGHTSKYIASMRGNRKGNL